MKHSSPTITWTVAQGGGLIWRSWGETSFAYQIDSGQTHAFNRLAVSILENIAEQPGCTDEIFQRLLDQYEIENTEDLRAATHETIRVLDHLGLVEPLS